MSSAHITHLLTDYIDGTLSGNTLDKVKSHLVFCNACRQTMNEIKNHIQLLKKTPMVAPSKELEQRILNAISEKPSSVKKSEEKPSALLQWFLSYRGMSLAGAAVLLIFVVQHAPKMMEESRQEKLKAVPLAKPAPAPMDIDTQAPVTDRAMAEVEAKRVPERANNTAPSVDKGSPWIAAGKPVEQTVDKISQLKDKNLPQKATEERLGHMSGAAASSGINKEERRSAIVAKEAVSQLRPLSDSKLNSSIVIDNEDISGYSSGITQPLEKVISDQKTWEEFWEKHQKNQSSKTTPRAVDFEKNQIIAVFAGNQPTAGFRVEITRVLSTQWENAPARVVRYRVIGPPEGTFSATVLTQPYVIKVVPRTYGPTFFKKIR